MNNNFEKFNLNKEIIKSLNNLNYKVPSEVQSKTIPELLDNKDVIVKSKTGSGKTASFAIPICESIDINNNSVQALIVAPTRELALQIKEEISSIGRLKKIRCSAIFGKQPIKDQILELKQRVHIVVATPGRIIDHIGRKTISLDNLKYFIIDEADKMLNKGFVDDMESIFVKLPHKCTSGLFSATIDENISLICNKYMVNPIYIDIKINEKEVSQKQIIEKCINVTKENRYETLKKLIYSESPDSLIIFANKKDSVIDLYNKMKKDKFLVRQLHGDMSQEKRLYTIKDFKEHKFNIMICTDVASRGIHIDDISLVINYDIPKDKENYVHRIGRTGRQNKFGKAITLVSQNEEKYLEEIENYTNRKLHEIVEINEEEVNMGRVRFKEIESKLIKLRNDKKYEKDTNSEVTRIYLNAGKKKKIRVIDIVGTLSNIEGINNEDIGVVEVKDLCSYVDLLNNKGSKFLKKYKEISIKKKLVKVRKDNKN
ncbi:MULTISPECIES: DEAD/DEAH box helicase [unclassified Romboutsia]|uniref:DEAD/DEAH box helicase n=1 Tax=unclassified Romboutsia TaxID=2626894 RepID=UPI000822A6E7|nr:MULTISPECIES: DEAD/DEAH box helicase [unclassified Romboutsia]SCH42402.1 ATP-dependent RNA helicase dbpA [uncultured Clostridium sp.]